MESQHLQYQALLEMNAVQALYDQIEDFYEQYERKEICKGQLIASVSVIYAEINEIFFNLSPLI